MQYRVVIGPDHIAVDVDEGTSVLQAFRQAGFAMDAPCGGNGTCGKCKVKILQEDGREILKLACRTYVHSDIAVRLAASDKGHRILLDGICREVELRPILKRTPVALGKSALGDNRSEWKRLKEAVAHACGADAEAIRPNLLAASSLYGTRMHNDGVFEAVVCPDEIVAVRKEGEPMYAVAFDIGTTTIVGYLLDLATGEQRAVASMLNPQSAFGADVISRSKYALDHGTEVLSNAVRGALNDLIQQTAADAGVLPEEILLISVVGNTCMHHLFLGISPEPLVFAPYSSAVDEPLLLHARHYGICAHPSAKLMVLPNIAGFVGADTVGAVLAADLDHAEELTLLIDIGTNGEMVLGDRNQMAACSTAAGPAFEGALIRCGMRGAEGAIDHVSLRDGRCAYSVIDGGAAKGICGSGLLDAIAGMIETGIVDESGKILEAGKLTDPRALPLKERIRDIDGLRSFVLADAAETGGTPVYVTQKDIREVQLAKGAMAAGIYLLADKLGVAVSDIRRVLIAGAFGNYMSPHSACVLSLIPPELEDRIIPIGNAAGEGAKMAALNEDEFRRSGRITETCGYLELAAHPAFQDLFVDQLEFVSQKG